MSNEIIRRRALRSSGAAIDWESIARGMLDGVTQFEIPSGLYIDTSIDNFFSRRKGLKSVDITTDANTIAANCFSTCTGLERVVVPVGITSIRNYAFYLCSSLRSITLPEGLNSIGLYFTFQSKLTSITIPSTVTSIGNYLLPSATLLEEIVLLPTTPPALGGTNLVTWGSTTYSIYVPDASVEAYKAATNWSTYASKIKPISERPVGGGNS